VRSAASSKLWKSEEAEEGPQNLDLAGDEHFRCFYYECSEPSSTLVQCDRCEKWFHAKCAGYDCDLPANPEYDGRPIELKAYCRRCLDFNDLTHADVVEQEMEYTSCKSIDTKFLMNLRTVCDSGMDETLVLMVLHGPLCHFF
jgi:hypothetical protein